MLTQNRQKCWHRIVRRWWSNAHLWSVLELGRGLDQSVPLSDIACFPCLYLSICELLKRLWFHSRLHFLLSTVRQDICCTQMHLLCCIEWHVWKFQMLWEKLFFETSPTMSSPLSYQFKMFLFVIKASMDFPSWLFPNREHMYSFKKSTDTKCTLLFCFVDGAELVLTNISFSPW